jgi:hypothetical protein
VRWIVTADKQQQCVSICKELCQIASDKATFLSRVITGVWICGYDPQTKQQSSQWKSSNSPRPKAMREVKSKVKNMLIIFYHVEGIAQKEFILAGQTVSSAYYCDDLWRLHGNE